MCQVYFDRQTRDDILWNHPDMGKGGMDLPNTKRAGIS